MNARELTLRSLEGLSTGDAFGECFFRVTPELVRLRQLPEAPWIWTDDTHMALSVVEVLLECGSIEQDELANSFIRRYMQEPWRGYGKGAMRLLASYVSGVDWRAEAPRLFNGGSYGNGAAMRAAPIGAYFSGIPERAVAEAEKSALVTHTHPEGRAGAVAVAIAASIFSSNADLSGSSFLREVVRFVPASRTRGGIEAAISLGAHEHARAVQTLGTGDQIAAFDTVPYCLWVVAYHAKDYETALWTTVAGMGDRDTTCAIVGGIVGQLRNVPEIWLGRREPLPEGYTV
jgi:ADP-ribosylglycohydrolase